MYLGLFVSVLLHASLVGWTFVSIQSTPELRAPTVEPVAVDLISPSELTKLTKGSRDAKLREAVAKDSPHRDATPKEAPRPRPIAAPPPPPPPPAPEPPPPARAPDPPPPPKAAEAPPPPAPEPPQPQPDRAALEQKIADLAALQQVEEAKRQAEAKAKAEADAQAKADAKARQEAEAKAKADAEAKRIADLKRKQDEKRKLDEKRKQEAKRKDDAEKQRLAQQEKNKLNVDRISALLDKSPDQRAPAPGAPEPKSDTRAKGPVLGTKEGRDAVNAANERSALARFMRDAMSRCWNISAGLDGIDKIVVIVDVRFNRDGSLTRPPEVVNAERSPLFQHMADSALRALIGCGPYQMPPDMYEGGWEHMRLRFTADMFR